MTRTRAAWWLACLVVAGCAPTQQPPAVPQSAPPAAAAPSQPVSDQATDIPWSAGRPLTWDDFRGRAPLEGAEQARTVYLLSYQSRCRGIDFTADITALMLPVQSWVKPQVLAAGAASARVLRHEQTHFDLTEVYARRMRRYFADVYNPCGMPDERLREAVDRFGREEAEAQRRYDQETGYGLKDLVQDRWDREVAEMLASLATFAK